MFMQDEGKEGEGSGWVYRAGMEAVVCLIGPMMPHLAEQLWQNLGHVTLLADTPWPQADKTLLVEENVTVAVQVNGKLRGTLDLPKDTDNKTAEDASLKIPNVIEAIGTKSVKKVIVVPNRIINVVI